MPFFLMLFSVIAWSLYPLAGAWGTNDINVAEFIIWASLISAGFSYMILKAVLYRNKDKNISLPKFFDLPRMIKIQTIIGSIIGMLALVTLLYAFKYMSRAGATVIYEIWPIITMFIAPLLIQKSWESISIKDYFLSLLALIGVGLISYPELQSEFFKESHPVWKYALLLLPLFGGVCMAVFSTIKVRVSHLIEIKEAPLCSFLLVQIYFALFTAIAALPLLFFWPDQESSYTLQNISCLFFVGIVTYALGNLAYAIALLRTEKSNIVVLWYMVPVLSVFFLWIAGETNITPYIILGSCFIISANLAITIRADGSKAYQAAIFTLLASGTFSFFFIGHEMNDFFDAISVPIIFFTIMVAFMMDRLLTRDTTEEGLAVSIINKVEHLKKTSTDAKHKINQAIIDIITTHDRAKMHTAYNSIRGDHLGDDPELATQIDKLVLSKTQNTSFAEIFVLMMVGVLIIAMALIYHPTSFIGDCFAVIVTTTLTFIIFNVLDITNHRREFSLQIKKGQKPILEEHENNLKAERIISVILLLLVMAAYIGLFYFKHLTIAA